MMYEVETQVISSIVAPTVPRISGSATLTIDPLGSIAAMSEPNAIAIVTTHLFTGSRWARTIGSVATAAVTARLSALEAEPESSFQDVNLDSFFGAAVAKMCAAQLEPQRPHSVRGQIAGKKARAGSWRRVGTAPRAPAARTLGMRR